MGTIFDDTGCFYRALDDEPVFVLLARDPCAAETVRWWVTLRQALIGQGQKPLEDHEMLAAALTTAGDMKLWRSDATDPQRWGPNTKRWQVEPAPKRELVEEGLVDKLRDRILKDANQFLMYATSHFAKPSAESHEKGEVNWQHYLDCIALLDLNPADKPEINSTKGKSETISASGMLLRRAMDLGTEGAADELLRKHVLNCEPDRVITLHADVIQRALAAALERRSTTEKLAIQLTADASPIRMALNEAAAKLEAWAGDKVSSRADEAREIANGIKEQAGKIMPMPFIAYDLAAKISVGIRQVVGDYITQVNQSTWPYSRKSKMLEFADRLSGYARELEDGRMQAERMQTRPIGKSPLFGEPYGGTGPSYAFVAEAKGDELKAPTDMRDVTSTPELPPHRFAIFEKGREWAYGRGLEINPSHIPAMLDRMEQDGWHLQCVFGGIVPEQVGMLFYRRQPSAFEAVHGYRDWPDAPLPERPEMTAWREGTPLGDIGTGSDAIRIHDDPNSLPHYLGTYDGYGIWIDPKAPSTVRSCVMSLLQEPCGPGGRGRGLEP